MSKTYLIEKLVERTTGNRYPEIPRASQMLVEMHEAKRQTDIPSPVPSFDYLTEYELSAKISVRYTANDAQHAHAREDATRQLQYGLYRDFIEGLMEARNTTPDMETKIILGGLLQMAGVG